MSALPPKAAIRARSVQCPLCAKSCRRTDLKQCPLFARNYRIKTSAHVRVKAAVHRHAFSGQNITAAPLLPLPA